MTLDETIKYVEEEADEYERRVEVKDYTTYDLVRANHNRRLAEWLKELKQLREQTRWIPVSERSPEKSGNYWCTFGGTNLTGSDHYTTESDAKELFIGLEEYAGWRSKNVVAWMPLPQGYREADE